MKKKHFNIPIFIPELACPFRCIYCDQCKISGETGIPDDRSILTTIENRLSTIPVNSDVQLAYFGGNFTGIPAEAQEHYLKLALPYVESGRISGIRLSTRPDYINDRVLDLLKKYPVETIELGAQSMDDSVLVQSARGHTPEDTERASRKIREYGFSLGLQMMIGLPGDDLPKARFTAQQIIALGAASTRIYPTLVVRGTQLETMFRHGKYHPLSLAEAVLWSKELLLLFEAAGVQVLRLGLHPSEGLLSGTHLVAGPFHPSFRELVETRIWNDILKPLTCKTAKNIEIMVPFGQINPAIGYQGENKKMLEKYYSRIKFKVSDQLDHRSFSTHIME